MDDDFRRTTDHDVIRAWIEEHDGIPVVVPGTDDDEEIIELAFGVDPEDEGLETISWDEFFVQFDANNLIFQYIDQVIPGQEELSYNFISIENPPDSGEEDETELPEENEVAEENMRNDGEA